MSLKSNRSNGYSYNKSQQDALFFDFILVKNSTCFGQTYLSIIKSLNTVFTATGICHTSYVDYLLSRSGWTLLAYTQHNKCDKYLLL